MKDYSCHFCYLPELVSALSGLLDVVIALEPVAVAVACVALAAAAKAARFCIGLRPNTHKQIYITSRLFTHLPLTKSEL